MIGNIKIESEGIGSLPRPLSLIKSINEFRNGNGKITKENLDKEINCAIKETMDELIKCEQSCLTDGEQSKVSFIGYPIFGSNQFVGDAMVYMKQKNEIKLEDPNVAVTINFLDGHSRHIPVLKSGPFRYVRYASDFVKEALSINPGYPYKQCIISPSALMLVYPSQPIDGYPREQFISDLLNECEKDIRQCFDAGASYVQIDATELRLSLKLDPSGSLFDAMCGIISSLLSRFNDQELQKLCLHECRGGDQGSSHSETVDITQKLLPSILSLPFGRFFIEYAQEDNKELILQTVKSYLKPNQLVFFAVTRINNQVESIEEIKKIAYEIVKAIPPNQFGFSDTCGWSPFYDDNTLPREIAFEKMKNRSKVAKQIENELNQK